VSLSTSFEKRHLPDTLWFHKRATGGGEAFTPVQNFLLLEDDDGSGTSRLLLEDDPGDGSSALELEDSNV
jgi:hypothetical protein